MLLAPTYQGQRVHIVSDVLCGHSSEEVVSQPPTYNFFWAQDPELDPLHVPERSRRVDGRHFSASRQGDGETEHGLGNRLQRQRNVASITTCCPALSVHPSNLKLNLNSDRTTDYPLSVFLTGPESLQAFSEAVSASCCAFILACNKHDAMTAMRKWCYTLSIISRLFVSKISLFGR